MQKREFITGDLVVFKPEITKANERANKSKAKNKWYRDDINRNSFDPYLWPKGVLQITWGLNEPLVSPDHWAGGNMVEVKEYHPSFPGERPIYAQVNINRLEYLPPADEDLLTTLGDIGL